MMKGMVVLLLLSTITVVQGLCSFPSELVGSSYQKTSLLPFIETYTFSETQIIVEETTGFIPTTTYDCIEKNGDFFMVRNEEVFVCMKFTSTDNLKPQAYEVGGIRGATGTPSICDVCTIRRFPPPQSQLFRVYQSGDTYPSPLPLGCDIPFGCPLTATGTPCSITLERFCSELLGIHDGACSESSEISESSESTSVSSSSELGGGGGAGRRTLRRRIQGRKQKGKSNSKEKCKKYERLEALIKETCE